MDKPKRTKPPHCLQCGKFLKRIPVMGLRMMGRACIEHGLVSLEEEPKLERLKEAFLLLHRENSFLLRKYMGKGRIK